MEDTAGKVENISEKGRDVHMTLKFLRHGERTPQTTLPSGEVTGGTLKVVDPYSR